MTGHETNRIDTHCMQLIIHQQQVSFTLLISLEENHVIIMTSIEIQLRSVRHRPPKKFTPRRSQ